MNLKHLIGRKAENYHADKGTIIAAEYVKDFDKLKKYDSTQWLSKDQLRLLNISKNDILVAFRDDQTKEVHVYTFENGGVTVRYSEPIEIGRWFLSNVLAAKQERKILTTLFDLSISGLITQDQIQQIEQNYSCSFMYAIPFICNSGQTALSLTFEYNSIHI